MLTTPPPPSSIKTKEIRPMTGSKTENLSLEKVKESRTEFLMMRLSWTMTTGAFEALGQELMASWEAWSLAR